MDKYTYNLKTDKIQKLVRQGDYATALKICDTMEWSQERNVRLLIAAAETYEQFDRDDEATELYLRAYEYSTAGKRILYKLTVLALKSGRLQDAETFYRKYLEEAEDDSNRFILRYLIAKEKDEPLQRKIDILEAYHRYEFEEKWACELAELYQQAKEKEKCVSLCDKVILYFAIGPYVERAMELKETFEPLTEEQQDRRENKAYYEDQVRKIAEEMASIDESDVRTPEISAEEEKLARERSAEHMANYTASVDISMIQEIMEERHEEPHPGEYEDPMGAVDVIPVSDTGELATTAADPEEEPEISIAIENEEVPAEEESVVEEEVPAEEESVVEEEIPGEEEPVVEEEVPAEEEPAVEEEVPGEEEPVVEEEIPGEEEPAVEEEVPGEEEPVVEEEVPAEEEPVVEEEVPSELTKNLQDTPGWKEVFRQSVEENTDPTKEIVIPRDFLQKAENGELAITNTTEDVLATPESILVQTQEDIPIIAMDEIEQAELENQLDEVPSVAIGFSHEHCLFLVTNSEENAVDQAVDALDQYYAALHRGLSPIAKIPAEKLNQRGLVHSLPQLNHKDLIILKASGLSDKILMEILEVIDYLDTDKVFVLMDDDEGINEVRLRMVELNQENRKNKDLPSIQVEETAAEKKENKEKETAKKESPSFENISENQILSKKDFIRYAEYFAKEVECVIDESGLDALEEEMNQILKESGKLTAGDVEDLIEDAAEQAEKATIRRMFSSKYNKEGFLILRKRNFK